MHTRRLVALLLGLWLGGTIFMTSVAIVNFQAVDRLLEAPDMSASQYIKVLGTNSTRTLLRHQVGEINRYLFENWELVQICLALVFGITLLFATNADKLYMGGAALLLLLVIVEHFLITPQVSTLGRALDFLPVDEQTVERVQFWKFHNAYSILEVIKVVLLFAVSIRLLMVRSHRRSRSRKAPATDTAA